VLEAEGLLVVHPSVPASSVAELIAYARASPGRLTFASAGMGTASHLAGELFKTMAKVEMTHVPYKGNVPAITDLLAGQTSLIFATMPTVLPHAKAGKVRPAGTPPDIVRRWNGEVMRIMQSPEIQARLPNEGARFMPMTPEQFGAFQRSEIAKWAPVVRASGARVE
jgi:tripartite-type tricarboxylate transporter receptor subunit TctC